MGRVLEALTQASADGVPDASTSTSTSRFERFYELLSNLGQLPKNQDAALLEKLRQSFVRFDASARILPSKEAREAVESSAAFSIANYLAQSALAKFEAIPAAEKLQFFVDGIATVLAMNHASPNEVLKPTEFDGERFANQWVNFKTSGSEALNRPGFLKNFLEIRNQVRQVFGIPKDTGPAAAK